MNKISILNGLLYECYEGTIENFNFDFKNNRILFSLNVTHINRIDYYQVTFFNVSSYYFINDEAKSRFNFIKYNRLWITSIYYYEKGIGKIDIHSPQEDWAEEQYYSGANFALEICETILFIEAEAIQINDQYFHVGFPKI